MFSSNFPCHKQWAEKKIFILLKKIFNKVLTQSSVDLTEIGQFLDGYLYTSYINIYYNIASNKIIADIYTKGYEDHIWWEESITEYCSTLLLLSQCYFSNSTWIIIKVIATNLINWTNKYY